jgi:hypothetical protein
MLIVEKIFQVRCTYCKNIFKFQDESLVPEICPACLDGKMSESEEDALEKARQKRENGGSKIKSYKQFNV